MCESTIQNKCSPLALPAFALGQAQNAERSLLVVDDVVDRRPSIVRRKFAEGNRGATEVGA